MVYKFFEDIFEYEKFPVEFECFKQLKDIQTINYVAVPWTQILNSHWLNFPNKQPSEYYFRYLSKINITQKHNFTVCQHDSYMLLENYFKHLNIDTVFTPLHDTSNKLKDINIIPISFTSMWEFDNVKKDILVSFIGTHTSHPIRERMRYRLHGPNIIYRDQYHIQAQTFQVENFKKTEEIEYKQTLQRSRFSLCPRGSSPSSVRFWESIHAGAIPILISDNWHLPEWDWDNTIVKIKESDFESMDYEDVTNILSNITSNQENMMRDNCRKAFEFFRMSKYKDYIFDNIVINKNI